jgi:hypothetical protein
VSRVFQGLGYNINVRREGKDNRVKLIVDGHAIEEIVIPKRAAGVTQVIMEVALV